MFGGRGGGAGLRQIVFGGGCEQEYYMSGKASFWKTWKKLLIKIDRLEGGGGRVHQLIVAVLIVKQQ